MEIDGTIFEAFDGANHASRVLPFADVILFYKLSYSKRQQRLPREGEGAGHGDGERTVHISLRLGVSNVLEGDFGEYFVDFVPDEFSLFVSETFRNSVLTAR